MIAFSQSEKYAQCKRTFSTCVYRIFIQDLLKSTDIAHIEGSCLKVPSHYATANAFSLSSQLDYTVTGGIVHIALAYPFIATTTVTISKTLSQLSGVNGP